MSTDKPRQRVLDAWNRIRQKSETHPRLATSTEAAIRAEEREQKLDRRSLRRTGRTEQLNVRVKAETKQTIHAIAEQNGLKIAQVIERAIEALERTIANKSQ